MPHQRRCRVHDGPWLLRPHPFHRLSPDAAPSPWPPPPRPSPSPLPPPRRTDATTTTTRTATDCPTRWRCPTACGPRASPPGGARPSTSARSPTAASSPATCAVVAPGCCWRRRPGGRCAGCTSTGAPAWSGRWAASTPSPHVWAVDGRTGAVVADVLVPDGGFLNDLVVGERAVWFTDSSVDRLGRIALNRRGAPRKRPDVHRAHRRMARHRGRRLRCERHPTALRRVARPQQQHRRRPVAGEPAHRCGPGDRRDRRPATGQW